MIGIRQMLSQCFENYIVYQNANTIKYFYLIHTF